MKKKFKRLSISLVCCALLSMPLYLFAGFWTVTYCKSAPLETYDAVYSETIDVFGFEVSGNGVITYELDC